MSMLAILSILAGAVLGLRFNIFILVPAIGLGILCIVGIGVAHSGVFSTIASAVAVWIVCLQIGYLGGTLTRHLLILARAARMIRASPRGVVGPRSVH